jgi:hypothetical protein
MYDTFTGMDTLATPPTQPHRCAGGHTDVPDLVCVAQPARSKQRQSSPRSIAALLQNTKHTRG